MSRLILYLTSDSDSAPNSTPESIFTQKTIISKSRMLEKCTNRNMNLMIIIGKSWSWHCLHIALHDSRCVRTVQVQCVRWAKSVPSVGDRLSLFTPPILSSIIFLVFHHSCALTRAPSRVLSLATRPCKTPSRTHKWIVCLSLSWFLWPFKTLLSKLVYGRAIKK